MATIFTMTITTSKGEREISIDPDEIPMGVLEDLENLGEAKRWRDIRPIICGLFQLTNDEFREMTAKQFMQIAQAIPAAVNEATAIPNGPGPL